MLTGVLQFHRSRKRPVENTAPVHQSGVAAGVSPEQTKVCAALLRDLTQYRCISARQNRACPRQSLKISSLHSTNLHSTNYHKTLKFQNLHPKTSKVTHVRSRKKDGYPILHRISIFFLKVFSRCRTHDPAALAISAERWYAANRQRSAGISPELSR